MSASAPIPLTDPAGLDDVCRAPVAVIYKHSSRCGASIGAAREMARFADLEADVPVYVVDVVRDRATAGEVARRLGVRHESPQAILVRDGVAVWDASHRGVTAAALSRALADR